MPDQTKYKAIKVTKDNKHVLEGQYSLANNFLEYSSGLFLIAEFGDHQYHALLTKAGLEANFKRTGKELTNGYFEIDRKPVEPIVVRNERA